MKSAATDHPKTPTSLAGIGVMLCLPGVIGLALLPWQARLRGHGVRTGFDEFLEAHLHSDGALSAVGVIYLAGIVIGIGCFRGSRWVRWALPAFLGSLSLFGLFVGRAWDSVWAATWMVAALVFFFRSTRMSAYFNRSEQAVPPNRSEAPPLDSKSSVRGSEDS